MYQVRVGSLIVIAKHAIDAIELFDRYREEGGDPVEIRRNGKVVDVEDLRASRTVQRGARISRAAFGM